MHSDPDFLWFFVFWMVLGIGGAAFFLGSRNAGLKRKALPLYIVAISVIFLGFIYFADGTVPWLVLVFVPLIGLLNIRMTKFCNSCGATIISRNFFSTPRYCQMCGAKLTEPT